MQEYEIDVNGIPHTVLLDDEDAALRGLTKKAAAEKAKTSPNKSRSAALNKS